MDNPFEPIYSRLDKLLDRIEAMDKRLDIAISPGDPNGLISKREAAKILNTSQQTVDNRVKQGLLKKHTVGSRSKFVRHEVMALIK
jgi:excisionase family DNA binding protein